MKPKEVYFTLVETVQAELKVKGSKFIADIFPVADIAAAQGKIEQMQQLHPKAVHHCFAIKLGVPSSITRSSDDGEPSGTAGKPIMGQLDSFHLTNVVAVVTRYFGGTLLGTGGLRKAYKEVVRLALENQEFKEIKKQYRITITFDITMLPQVMHAAKRFPGQITTKNTVLSPYVTILTETDEIDYEISQLKSNILNLPPDYASIVVDPGFQITIT